MSFCWIHQRSFHGFVMAKTVVLILLVGISQSSLPKTFAKQHILPIEENFSLRARVSHQSHLVSDVSYIFNTKKDNEKKRKLKDNSNTGQGQLRLPSTFSKTTTSTTTTTTTVPHTTTNEEGLPRDQDGELDVINEFEAEELLLELSYACEVDGEIFVYESVHDMSGPWEACTGIEGNECKALIASDPEIDINKIRIMRPDDIVNKQLDMCRVLVYVNSTDIVQGIPARG